MYRSSCLRGNQTVGVFNTADVLDGWEDKRKRLKVGITWTGVCEEGGLPTPACFKSPTRWSAVYFNSIPPWNLFLQFWFFFGGGNLFKPPSEKADPSVALFRDCKSHLPGVSVSPANNAWDFTLRKKNKKKNQNKSSPTHGDVMAIIMFHMVWQT